MKIIGTRKEVFYGLALKTQCGMSKKDIIKSSKNKSKKVFINKKKSSMLNENNPLITYRKKNKSKKIEKDLERLSVSDLKKTLLRERKLLRLKRRKLKSLKYKKINNKKEKTKKLSFALDKNKTKEFYCSSLNNNCNEYKEEDMFSSTIFSGYERDDEDNLDYKSTTYQKELKIEEPPEISLDELFI